MNWRSILAGLLLCGGWPFNTNALAQTYQLEWFALSPGYSQSTSAVYSVTGSISRAGSGNSSGGAYSLAGGDLALLEVIQTGGAVKLTAIRSPGQVRLAWPLSANDWALEEAGSLSAGGLVWARLPAASFQTNTAEIFIDIKISQGTRFYRLAR